MVGWWFSLLAHALGSHDLVCDQQYNVLQYYTVSGVIFVSSIGICEYRDDDGLTKVIIVEVAVHPH